MIKDISKFILLFFSIMLITTSFLLNNYVFSYFSIVFFLIISFLNISGLFRLVVFFLVFYLSIGLLNISTWRGYIEVEVINLYFLCVLLFLIPCVFIRCYVTDRNNFHVSNQKFILMAILIHLLIVYVSVLAVYIFYGNILLNQTIRFLIPTSLEYVIKSALPIAALIPILKYKNKALLLLLVVLPAILIGSRGTAVISILSYLISDVYFKFGGFDIYKIINKNKKFLIYSLLAFLVIISGFYLRRGDGSELSSVDVLMSHYFDYDNILIRVILPFHLGFKETIGLSNRLVIESIANNINTYSLFFADLFTVLPGERLAAGQTLGRIFGTVEGGGLTPGLVGGIYIDYKMFTPAFFLLFGVSFYFLEAKLYKSPLFIVVYSQVIVQFIHLFHRGFLKPEYITSVLIAYFYYCLCHRIIINRG
ncbi:TPA: hypothetical protein ACMDO2_002574 [Vibrio parahaemolyticus]